MAWDTITPYHRGFREFTAAYEAFDFEDIHRDALNFLPSTPGLILDVGAGSGRDAGWFATHGWDVIAAEPANALRDEAKRLHEDARIRWIDDRLPGMVATHQLGLAFDLIWLSGVWQHIRPEDRARAMRKLVMLLKPGGRIMMTLRHGPAPDDRPMWPVNAMEVERLGLDHGLALRVATERREDRQGRADVRWQTVILDLPDDGAGALPLLRGVILRQEKSATYKLALLRCLARIADTSPNIARDAGEHIELPLGLIALYWIRMFKPLEERRLPQLPGGSMGFAKEAFRALQPLAPFELRLGARFEGHFGEALRKALGDAARLIASMPATHLTFADDQPVFPTAYGRLPKTQSALQLEAGLLWEYGATRVPLGIWQALRRMSAWIEPMLVAEWVRLTRQYAERAGRDLSADHVQAALRWLEPERDTLFVRNLAHERLDRGVPVECVWSGQGLRKTSIDIDHCLPWSAWPCGDLWNLLPSAPSINRNSKRELIVGAAKLTEAKPRIMHWWQEAYLEGAHPLRLRFLEEARGTLPVAGEAGGLNLEDLFAALDFRRLRLRQETQIAEWHGVRKQ